MSLHGQVLELIRSKMGEVPRIFPGTEVSVLVSFEGEVM